MLKYALPHADVIAASYPFVFMPQILARLIDWIGIPLHRTVIVVDEAHNLPDYLRDVQTFASPRRRRGRTATTRSTRALRSPTSSACSGRSSDMP